MKLSEIFKKIINNKENYNIEELENEYLNEDKNKMYSFQEKYSNQEQKLLNIYGNSNNLPINKLKLIIITDTHNSLNEDELVDFLNKHQNYDVCLLLGDHSGYDVEKVLNHISKDKIYALLGNHDSDYITAYGLNDLNGNIITINGVKLLGIKGSFRYKPSDFPSFTQAESVAFLLNKEPCDILISHDGPFNNSSFNNPAHQGLFGITYYLFKNKVKYNIHGHLHEPYNKTLLNGTKEISLYGINYIELD